MERQVGNYYHLFHIKCNGSLECAGSIIKCPEYSKCDVICSADACGGSTIKCPEYSDCHVICSASRACESTIILWSKQLVQSTLTCNDTSGVGKECVETTQPPKYYQYKNMGNTMRITNDFEMYFKVKINQSSYTYNTSYYSILSIYDDTNFPMMDLSINNKDDLVQISLGDTYLVKGGLIIPKDNQYHSVHIIFNQESQTIFKIDDVVYLNIMLSDSHLSFSSLYQNNKTYSAWIGDGNIGNTTLNIPLSTYYQISDESSFPDVKCYQILDALPYIEGWITPIGYWNKTMIIIDEWNLYVVDLSDMNETSLDCVKKLICIFVFFCVN